MSDVPERPGTIEIVDVSASRKALLADGLASLVIWYNFGILGLLSIFVGRSLVPSESASVAALLVLAVFATGFFTRPIGSAAFQKFNAKFGLNASHALVIVGMTAATAMMGLLPDQHTSGYLGLVLLIVLRLTQGIFAGAELPGPIAQMASSAPPGMRGRLSCWPMTINLSGYTASAAMALALVSMFGEAATFAGAWRYGFFAAMPLAVVAAVLRFKVGMPVVRKTVAKTDARAPQAPAADLTRLRDVLLTLGSVLVYNASTGAFQVGLPWILVSVSDWDLRTALGMALLFGLAPLTFPAFGSVADRIGHMRMLGVGSLGVLLLAYPCFMLLDMGTGKVIIAVAMGFVLMGILGGSIQGFLAERMPSRSPTIRLVYALSAAIFGGTSPFIINALAHYFHQVAPAGSYYLVASGAVSAVSLLGIYFASRRNPMAATRSA